MNEWWGYGWQDARQGWVEWGGAWQKYCRASCLMIFSFGWFFCSFPFFVLEPGGCKTFTLQTFDTGEACCMRHKPSSIYLQSNCLFMAPIPSKPRHSCTFPSCNVFLPAQDSKPPSLLAQQLKAWTARLLGAATADLPLPVWLDFVGKTVLLLL